MNRHRRYLRDAALLVALVGLLVPGLSTGGSASAADDLPPRVGGQLNVGFDDGALPGVGSLIAGATVIDTIDALDVATLDAGPGIETSQLAAVPGVRYIEEDVRLSAFVTPDDSRYANQYGPAQIGAPAAWSAVGFGSDDVIVAVLDTGIRSTHQDFETSRVLPGHDYVSDDGVPNDSCGHGTHVAGTVAATTDNGVGVAGVSQATILPLKVLAPVGGLFTVTCSGSTSDVAEAIVDAADQGADVISMSLGGGSSTTLRNAVDYAAGKGVLVVAASGNDSSSNGVSYPAAYDNAIAVGATTSSKARASYSNGGPQLDIVAPGSSIISTYHGSNTDYDTLSGTSMATPHVAGALALVKGCAPSATANELRAAMEATAEDRGAAGRDNLYGHGIIRVDRMVEQLCAGGGTTTSTTTSTSTSTTTTSTTSTTSTTAPSTTTTEPSGDPDPSTPTITSGSTRTLTINASNADHHVKIAIPAGASNLTVTIDGPSCGLISCSVDADLYTRAAQRPTDRSYACRPYLAGSDETCSHSSPDPSNGYWYIRVKRYSGSGTITLRATVS